MNGFSPGSMKITEYWKEYFQVTTYNDKLKKKRLKSYILPK